MRATNQAIDQADPYPYPDPDSIPRTDPYPYPDPGSIPRFAALAGLYFALQATRSFALATFVTAASVALHRRLTHRLFKLPLTFFETTPLGRIINRLVPDPTSIFIPT